MENSFSIANFFIKKSQDEKRLITPLQLVKFVYLSHGWYMGFYENPLIPDTIEAWKYGPVVPPIYHEFKKFGDEYITCFAQDINDVYEGKYQIPTGEAELELLNKIWEVYGQMSGIELSTITHEKGSPWDQVWNIQDGRNITGAVIPNHIIKKYYQDKIKNGKES